LQQLIEEVLATQERWIIIASSKSNGKMSEEEGMWENLDEEGTRRFSLDGMSLICCRYGTGSQRHGGR
jgi:hypothetical protein